MTESVFTYSTAEDLLACTRGLKENESDKCVLIPFPRRFYNKKDTVWNENVRRFVFICDVGVDEQGAEWKGLEKRDNGMEKQIVGENEEKLTLRGKWD